MSRERKRSIAKIVYFAMEYSIITAKIAAGLIFIILILYLFITEDFSIFTEYPNLVIIFIYAMVEFGEMLLHTIISAPKRIREDLSNMRR